jgi:hypothetical protein
VGTKKKKEQKIEKPIYSSRAPLHLRQPFSQPAFNVFKALAGKWPGNSQNVQVRLDVNVGNELVVDCACIFKCFDGEGVL